MKKPAGEGHKMRLRSVNARTGKKRNYRLRLTHIKRNHLIINNTTR